MLNNTRQNYHHSKLPKPGEIGYLIDGYERYTNKPRFCHGQRQRYQVVSFPLIDSPSYRGHFFSLGIHTAFFQNLKTGKVERFSGFYFTPEDEI